MYNIFITISLLTKIRDGNPPNFWKYSEFHEYLPKKADQSADSGFLDFLRIDNCGFYKYIFKGNFINKKKD